MRESIAQSFIISLILFFFGILVILFFGSLNYSKAFKAKNRIITIIEKYGGYTEEARTEIESDLSKSGYQTTVDNYSYTKCNDIANKNGGNKLFPDNNDARRNDYCIIEYTNDIGSYYQVVTFMQIEVPIFEGFLRFPVTGETKVLYDNFR